MNIVPQLSRRDWLRAAAAGLAGGALRAADSEPFTIKSGGGEIEVSLSGDFAVTHASTSAWVSTAARAVTTYFGKFPVPKTLVQVRSGRGRPGVGGGTTYAEDPPRTVIRMGEGTTAEQLADDWTMTHELVHLSFPDMPREHHWIEEGIATYVEPIARAQIGTMEPERVWGDMFFQMAQGQPAANDRGLDFTHTWGRTYWGGALFCLAAEIKIRERTHNRYGLQQALRGIVKAGGSIESDWPIEQALATADKAVGVPVLSELYGEMKDKPAPVDLDRIWKRLGVERAPEGRRVMLRNDAELAAVRRAITRRV